jgi:hypothetical protein
MSKHTEYDTCWNRTKDLAILSLFVFACLLSTQGTVLRVGGHYAGIQEQVAGAAELGKAGIPRQHLSFGGRLFGKSVLVERLFWVRCVRSL